MVKLNTHGGGRSPRACISARGVALPTVTEVLRVTEGEWMNAMLQRKGRKDTEKLMSEAAALGTRVHKVAEILAWNRDAQISGDMAPYAGGIREFLNTYTRRILATELSLTSDRLGFGGTLDLITELTDGTLAVIDYKTSAGGVTKAHKLQTVGYAMLAREAGYKINRRLVVRIHKAPGREGEWYVRAAVDHQQDIETFMACLTVWGFLHGAKLEKMGRRAT